MDFDIMALIQALRGTSGTDQDSAAKARANAERIARTLPSAVMPLEAIEADRRRKAAIDKLLSETQ